jgi:UDP-N-acetyl-D-glucosamine dehydrogenase
MGIATAGVSERVRVNEMARFEELLRIREARIAVIGLGYVGLPVAVAYAQLGFQVVGIDIDETKIDMLARNHSPLGEVSSDDVAAVRTSGHLAVDSSYDSLNTADAVFICVPTPCTRNKEPDTANIEAAALGIARHLRAGQLVILRSTSYPGTTEELVLPILEAKGFTAGKDIFLAFVPERVDPGRKDYTVHNTPVIVGGVGAGSTRRAALLMEQLGSPVKTVSSPAAAELAKLLENVFRNVNIALVNQLAMLCDRMGLDIWEVVGSAATKPYGFMPFYPGPGIGGHCIPVDPYYLAWKAREYDFHMDFIELAARVNEEMPYHVVTKLLLTLNGQHTRQQPARIMVLGVAFKRDVDDSRGSPALKIMELLIQRGARVSYHDPYISEFRVAGQELRSRRLTTTALAAADCVLIVADHSSFDYDWIVRHARLVFDTRNATKSVVDGRAKIVKL